MGTWQGPDNTDQLLELWRVTGSTVEAKDFVNALWLSGLLVRRPYYVPDTDELLGMMQALQYELRRSNLGCRWVMCRETVDALARRWSDKVAPAPIRFDASFWLNEGAGLPTAALEMEILTIIEYNSRWTDKARLFGVPIRLDPAARSPLFELDSEATDTRPYGALAWEVA